jgi:hypothetical protein
MNILSCGSCGQPVRHVDTIPGTESNPIEIWQGVVCLSCREVYCTKCRPIDSVTQLPDPCPTCRNELVPAYRNYLSEIGAV